MGDNTGAANRIDFLTGLKGIACIVVMLNHFAGVFYQKTYVPWETSPWATIFYNGTFMLYVFYILSGFFTAYALYGNNDNREQLGKRLFSRYFRLVIPVFFICLAILLMQHLNLYQAYDQVKSITQSSRSANDAANYYIKGSLTDAIKTALTAPLKKTTNFTFVLWMLPIIYKGFFVSIILSLLVRSLKPAPAISVLAMACIYFLGKNEFQSIAFVIGVCLSYIYVYAPSLYYEKISRLVGILCIPIAVLFGSHWPNSTANNAFVAYLLNRLPNYVPLFVVGSTALVVSAITLSPLRKLLSTKPFCFLGNISFGIYLVHDVIQICVGTNVFLIIYQYTSSIAFSRVAAFVSSTFFVIAGGYFIWKYIDKIANCIITKIWHLIKRNMQS